MSFNLGAGYNVKGVGDGQEQGFSPVDLRYLQEKFIEGSATPNMVISFGEGIVSNNAIANLSNVVYLYDMRCKFQTPTLGLRSQNLHRSGSTTASPVWGVVPKNLIAVSLMKNLHTNAIKEIVVNNLAYIGSSPSPIVTETRTFGSCFIIYLEPWAHGDFVVFAFTFVTLNWELKDFGQKNEDGNQSNPVGQRSYKFEFDTAGGTGGD